MAITVSVVVTTYNRKIWLIECLESLLKQKFPKDQFEIIVVDDGSFDRTKEAISKYRSNKVRYYFQENQGCASARNLAIDKAKGKIVAFIDDDEIASRSWLAILVEPLLNNKKIAATRGQRLVFNPTRIIEKYIDLNLIIYQKKISADIYPMTLLGGNSAYRKNIFKKIGSFDPSAPMDDADLSWRLSFKGYKTCYVKEAKTYERFSKSLTILKKQFIYGILMNQLITRHKKNLKKEFDSVDKPGLFLINEIISLWQGLKKIPSLYKNIPPRYRREKFIYLWLPFFTFLLYRIYRAGIIYESLKRKISYEN